MANWYVNNNGAQMGLLTEEMIEHYWQTGRIAGSALVCMEGDTRWVSIHHIPAIGNRLAQKHQPSIPIWVWILGVLAFFFMLAKAAVK